MMVSFAGTLGGLASYATASAAVRAAMNGVLPSAAI